MRKTQCVEQCAKNTKISLKKKEKPYAYTHTSQEGNREMNNICFLLGGVLMTGE